MGKIEHKILKTNPHYLHLLIWFDSEQLEAGQNCIDKNIRNVWDSRQIGWVISTKKLELQSPNKVAAVFAYMHPESLCIESTSSAIQKKALFKVPMLLASQRRPNSWLYLVVQFQTKSTLVRIILTGNTLIRMSKCIGRPMAIASF